MIGGLTEAGLELVLGSGGMRGNTFIFCVMIQVHPQQFPQEDVLLQDLGRWGHGGGESR